MSREVLPPQGIAVIAMVLGIRLMGLGKHLKCRKQMKAKNFFRTSAIALLSVALLFTAACNKREAIVERRSSPNVLIASMEQPSSDTKASLGSSPEHQVLWSEGDKIAVWFDDNTSMCEFTLKSGAGTNSASFTGIGSGTSVYAIYPYSNKAFISPDKTILFIFPSEQQYKEDGFDPNQFPMVAYTTSGGNLEFKNLFGLLKLQLKVASGKKVINKISFYSNYYMAGQHKVAMNYPSVPTSNWITASENGANGNFITLNLGSGVELTTTAKPFYIIIPPGSRGGDIFIESENGSMFKTIPNKVENTIVRSRILQMGVIDYVENREYPSRKYDYIENGKNYGKGIGVFLNSTLGIRYFAPVNCGYEIEDSGNNGYIYGKVYQFGRKYGQGVKRTRADNTYPSDDNIVAGAVSNEVVQDIGNKDKHYSGWSPSNSIWGGAFGVKVSNDPCPDGWRVPIYEELIAISRLPKTNAVSMHGSSSDINGCFLGPLFFPIAGGDIDHISTINESVGKYYGSNGYLTLGKTSSGVGSYSSILNSKSNLVRCIKDIPYSSSGGGEGHGEIIGEW